MAVDCSKQVGELEVGLHRVYIATPSAGQYLKRKCCGGRSFGGGFKLKADSSRLVVVRTCNCVEVHSACSRIFCSNVCGDVMTQGPQGR